MHFLESDLFEAHRLGESAKCARCKVLEDPAWNSKQFACQRCSAEKPLHAFSAIVCKHELLGERRQHRPCFECQYPTCSIAGCTARPDVAVAQNHLDANGNWLCRNHRYPPCSVCRITPRPASAMHSKMKVKDCICATCQTQPAGSRVLSVAASSSTSLPTASTPSLRMHMLLRLRLR